MSANNRGDTWLLATIANGQTTSSAIDLRADTSAGFILPAAFTGTGMTFQVSADNVTYTAHSATSVTVAQGKAYGIPADVAVFPWIKLVSGSSEAGARTITIVRKR